MIISVPNDGCKSNGHYIKTTGMRRTSNRRSIHLHPGQNGSCASVTEDPKVRMSRYLDTSTIVWKIQSFFLNEICTVILWQDYYKINARTDIANWRTKQLNRYTKSKQHALSTIKRKKKKLEQLENCLQLALKLL